MERMGVIRKSNSPYASPVVIVKKKDNTNRICVDCRKWNKITEFDPEPILSSDDLFTKLGGSKYFSKLDLSKGYWQIKVKDEDVKKTGFVTHDGHYLWIPDYSFWSDEFRWNPSKSHKEAFWRYGKCGILYWRHHHSYWRLGQTPGGVDGTF